LLAAECLAINNAAIIAHKHPSGGKLAQSSHTLKRDPNFNTNFNLNPTYPTKTLLTPTDTAGYNTTTSVFIAPSSAVAASFTAVL